MQRTRNEKLLLLATALLPALLAIIFAIAAYVPKATVPSPAHDFLFTVEKYNNNATTYEEFTVQDGVLMIKTGKHDRDYGGAVPVLMRYEAKTNTVREVMFVPPTTEEKWGSLALKELEGLRVDTGTVAPDGYSFLSDYRSNNITEELFLGSGNSNDLVLTKEGRNVRVPRINNISYYNTRFLGWLVPTGAVHE